MFLATLLLICFASNTYGDLVDKSKLGILLYTQEDPKTPIPLQTTNSSINVTKQLKIIVHGWNDNVNSIWAANIIKAYLQQGHTVIFIDWSSYATSLVYWPVIAFVQGVGNIIGDLAVNNFDFSLTIVECIGHSLGAHVCGFAGKYITKQNVSQKIGNITGLDPAGPGYEGVNSTLRLDASDANEVKAIHTNAGGEGIMQTVGKIDFFPNGGSQQPNCLVLDTNCSHYASITYWINGINSNQYVGTKCGSYATYQLEMCGGKPTAIMGEGTDASASGVFYLST